MRAWGSMLNIRRNLGLFAQFQTCTASKLFSSIAQPIDPSNSTAIQLYRPALDAVPESEVKNTIQLKGELVIRGNDSLLPESAQVDHWIKKIDPRTGYPYWKNIHTSEVTGIGAPKPDTWVRWFDVSAQSFVYLNVRTGEQTLPGERRPGIMGRTPPHLKWLVNDMEKAPPLRQEIEELLFPPAKAAIKIWIFLEGTDFLLGQFLDLCGIAY